MGQEPDAAIWQGCGTLGSWVPHNRSQPFSGGRVSCALKTVSSCYLATTLFGRMWSATGTLTWKHVQDRKHPQMMRGIRSPCTPSHGLPPYAGSHLPGQGSAATKQGSRKLPGPNSCRDVLVTPPPPPPPLASGQEPRCHLLSPNDLSS